jgi:hypothetical protein
LPLAAPAPRGGTPPPPPPFAPTATAAVRLTGEETIGEVLARHPQLEETIRLFFGDGCFSCPGQATENLAQAALLHNIDPALLLGELRKRI